MRGVRVALVVAAVSIGLVDLAGAQPADRPLTPLELTVGCAPPPSLDVPSDMPHVAGAQDTVSRSLYEARDLLVIDSGASNGIQIGQKFYVRRPVYAHAYRTQPRG